MTEISVIVPFYNSEKYILNCIKSILSNSFNDYEVICINNCSNDNSRTIVENLIKKDKRIKLINNSNNIGYGASLNIGIKKALGNFIYIVESDDEIEKNTLETMYNEHKKNNYDIVKSDFCYVNNKNKHKANIFNELNIDFKKDYSIIDNPNIITIKPTIWSVMYSKKFLLDNNICFSERQGASYQDTSFQFETLYKAKKIKFINKELYLYRTDNNNSSTHSTKNTNCIIEEFKIINKIIGNDKLILSKKLLIELKGYLWNLKRINKDDTTNFIKEANKILKEYDLKEFYNDNKIKFKEKIKMYLLTRKSIVSIILFTIYKKLATVHIL